MEIYNFHRKIYHEFPSIQREFMCAEIVRTNFIEVRNETRERAKKNDVIINDNSEIHFV